MARDLWGFLKGGLVCRETVARFVRGIGWEEVVRAEKEEVRLYSDRHGAYQTLSEALLTV